MKRQLIQRNKARQTLALRTYGIPTKPFLFRIFGPSPKTSVHTRRFCKRKQKRRQFNCGQVSLEAIRAFLRG
jgi:hypothetical protein